MSRERPVYLDCNATTPLDPRVREAMLPYLEDRFGNPASRHHLYGCEAAEAVETARMQVASVIGADPREIIWTSGATESDNLAIQGVIRSRAYPSRRDHVITVATEHKAVLDPCEALEREGHRVSVLGVNRAGRLDLDRLKEAIDDRTILVSVMHANNEIGVLHPIREIGAICKERGVLFHTDAAQSFGKETIDVEDFGIDLLSASAHKFYGPKGVGILYVRRRKPRVRCEPLLYGGGHERGLRSGTLNMLGIVGMGAAAALASKDSADGDRIRGLRDRLEMRIVTGVDSVRIHGQGAPRLAGTSNLSFDGVDGEELIGSVPGLALSSASACTSALLQPSYVLAALGLDEEEIRGSVRISLGRFTTEEEIDAAVEMLLEAVKKLREAHS